MVSLKTRTLALGRDCEENLHHDQVLVSLGFQLKSMLQYYNDDILLSGCSHFFEPNEVDRSWQHHHQNIESWTLCNRRSQ